LLECGRCEALLPRQKITGKQRRPLGDGGKGGGWEAARIRRTAEGGMGGNKKARGEAEKKKGCRCQEGKGAKPKNIDRREN
jgi:hypothetical protein